MKILILIFLICFTIVTSKPKCHPPQSYWSTAMGCSDGCCNTLTYGNCEIDECNLALADSCWMMACVNGRFSEEKWKELNAIWDQERWDDMVKKYGYTMHENCDSHEMDCMSVHRTLLFEEIQHDRPSRCCIPKCAVEYDSVIYHVEEIRSNCDFSAGEKVGYFHVKKA